ncbi:MAG: ribosome small subunit-dependent GTPase A [Flavobacteriia bacterium]|nr:ribosome small subunit-dependent GTPase A [Flavobacteriia bacterium]
MKYANNILETIGNTPLVRLNKITKEIPALVLAKIESFNPGNSVKDRMALKMVEDAENDGRLQPGGVIIEGTSGNTGMGLALAAIVKGYRLICVSNDKQSKEKFDVLRAMGAEVVVCPTAVAPEDPRSYYSVSKRLAEETPNSWYVNQYDNPSNSLAHYEQTGPEIWEQTEGKITHFVVGVGTGGTISGVAKFLKDKNPNIRVWGIDTYGSVFKKYHETGIFDEKEIYPYITEGIGEDILPANVDFELIDQFEKVTDQDAALYTRKLAREEGIFAGNSGVGKSSLINAVEPGLELKTSSTSQQHQQGQHTTTFAQMFDISFGGRIIDTPGIRGFGLATLERHEIGDYFKEFFALKSDCKFHNCLHDNEPHCAVKQALERGDIAQSRYDSYIGLLTDPEGPYRTDNYE